MIPSLTLFVHVVGMLTLFVGLGIEWVCRAARSVPPRANKPCRG
jgi:hypothetical protein